MTISALAEISMTAISINNLDILKARHSQQQLVTLYR